MLNFQISPREMIAGFWRNRNLITALVKREVVGRYRGSMMGILWSFFNPLLMLSVYTFVFGIIFNSRWNPYNDSKSEFALVLFAGQLVFNLFAECVNRAPSLILSNPNYVKKIVFPLEILPWISLGSAIVHTAISFGVWLIAYLVLMGLPPLTIFLLPIVILPLMLFIMGLSWILASLGVYLRDVSQFINIATTTLMFLSPIFYPVTAIPEKYRYLLFINPLTPAIEQVRDVLYWSKVPDLFLLTIHFVAAAIIAWFGFSWFQKTRNGFADVL